MSIDFATLQGLTIPEGVVTQITDASGRVLWVLGGSAAVLEVEKITSGTYAGETSYTNEQFILLDIYPKTNGTVKVIYGNLTKTITDTSGAEVPNAQQVFFGTFNGVSDDVATPESGKLVIMGDCYGFGQGAYAKDSGYKKSVSCCCVTAITDFGNADTIPPSAFTVRSYSGGTTTALKKVLITDGVKSIGQYAFSSCYGLEQMTIPASVVDIHEDAFEYTSTTWEGKFLTIDEANPAYSFKGSCLITKADNTVIHGFSDAVIPNGVKTIAENSFNTHLGLSAAFAIPEGVQSIGAYAFRSATGVTDLDLPSSLTVLGDGALLFSDIERVTIRATTPPTVLDNANGAGNLFVFNKSNLVTITVPKGCSGAYKAARGWSDFAEYIVEAS